MSIGMASKHARHTPGGTPGRRANITSNQYFDVGRVGRKTGVTLKDTGIRDDYGLEPLSDIFSTPRSAARSTYIEEEGEEQQQQQQDEDVGYYDDGSADMSDSPGQDLDELIQRRRQTSVRITPPRQVSKAGRSSIARPDTNRRSQFDENVRNSIEKRSPFKPTHVLRRSNVGGNHPRKSILTNGIGIHTPSPRTGPSKRKSEAFPIVEDEYQIAQDDEMDRSDQHDTLRYSTRDELEGALGHAEMLVHSSPITPQKRRLSQERSSSSGRANNRAQRGANVLPSASTSAKRPRLSAADDEDNTGVNASAAAPPPPSSRKLEKAPVYHAPIQDEEEPEDDGPLFVNDDYQNDYDDDDNNDYDDGPDGSIDVPAGGDQDDHGQDVDDNEPAPSPLVIMTATERAKRNRQEQGQHRSPKKSRVRITAPPRSSRRPRDEVSSDDDSNEDDSETGTRRVRRGTASNMRYRSTTPFEDADHKTTRSGRAVMKPLDWWAGEAVIWKNGEVGGVIRANSVEPEKRVVHKKRAAHKKKTQKIRNGLGAIDEQEEDLMPDEWEDEVGVFTGEVAMWNPDTEMGDDEDLVTEDLAFAASSIITRNVSGASFNYAKIQTLPFFGSGVVEIPPNGVKNTKNSKKMQMNFFVHKGKVQVTIATPAGVNAVSARSTIFTITEGGAWVVPRGNNYTINNLSSMTTAFLFFSQGCEVRDLEEAGAG